MSQILVVATFDNEDVAQRAARDFNNLASQGDGFKIESGVMVKKHSDGKLTVLNEHTRSYWGVDVGAVTGGLIGILGGPLGAVAGAAIGSGIGWAAHAVEQKLDLKMRRAIEEEMKPDSFALILEAKEPPEQELDDITRGYGGSLFTQKVAW